MSFQTCVRHELLPRHFASGCPSRMGLMLANGHWHLCSLQTLGQAKGWHSACAGCHDLRPEDQEPSDAGGHGEQPLYLEQGIREAWVDLDG